jgi:hypothetical protein
MEQHTCKYGNIRGFHGIGLADARALWVGGGVKGKVTLLVMPIMSFVSVGAVSLRAGLRLAKLWAR